MPKSPVTKAEPTVPGGASPDQSNCGVWAKTSHPPALAACTAVMARPAALTTSTNAVIRKKRAMSRRSPPRTTATPMTTATRIPVAAPHAPASGLVVVLPIKARTKTEISNPSRSTTRKAMTASADVDPLVRLRAALAVESREGPSGIDASRRPCRSPSARRPRRPRLRPGRWPRSTGSPRRGAA